jgi:hypothetical protein
MRYYLTAILLSVSLLAGAQRDTAHGPSVFYKQLDLIHIECDQLNTDSARMYRHKADSVAKEYDSVRLTYPTYLEKLIYDVACISRLSYYQDILYPKVMQKNTQDFMRLEPQMTEDFIREHMIPYYRQHYSLSEIKHYFPRAYAIIAAKVKHN